MVAVGKRERTSSVVTRGAAAKARRAGGAVIEVAPEEVTVTAEDPFSEECAAVLCLLDRASELSEASCGMLRAAAPHSLKTPKTERHALQQQFVDAIAGIFQSVEAAARAAVDGIHTQADEVAKERAEAVEALAAADAVVDARAQQRDEKDNDLKEASAASESASGAVGIAEKEQQMLSIEHADAAKEREETERLVADALAPLKAGTVSGKQWRERNKMIEQVMNGLERVGLEDSLKEALPVSFKTKPEERGNFANKAVDFSETVLKERIAAIGDRICGFDKEVEERASRVAQAKEVLAAADVVRMERAAALSATEEALRNAKEEQASANTIVESFTPKQNELEQKRRHAQAELDAILKLQGRFRAMAEAGDAATKGDDLPKLLD